MKNSKLNFDDCSLFTEITNEEAETISGGVFNRPFNFTMPQIDPNSLQRFGNTSVISETIITEDGKTINRLSITATAGEGETSIVKTPGSTVIVNGVRY